MSDAATSPTTPQTKAARSTLHMTHRSETAPSGTILRPAAAARSASTTEATVYAARCGSEVRPSPATSQAKTAERSTVTQ